MSKWIKEIFVSAWDHKVHEHVLTNAISSWGFKFCICKNTEPYTHFHVALDAFETDNIIHRYELSAGEAYDWISAAPECKEIEEDFNQIYRDEMSLIILFNQHN